MSVIPMLLGSANGITLSISGGGSGASPVTKILTVTPSSGTPTSYLWTFDGWVSGTEGSAGVDSGGTTASATVSVESYSGFSRARFRVAVVIDGITYEATTNVTAFL